MAMPQNVQRQLDAADAAQQAVAQAAATQVEGLVTDISQLETPPPAAPAPVEPTPPTPEPTAPPPKPDAAEQRFRTLQGMFNAERAKNVALESKVTQLASQMEALAAAKPATPAQPAQPDPRDAAQFGEDLVEMVQRYVTRALDQMRNEVSTFGAQFDSRVKALESSVHGVSQRTEMTLEQSFYRALDQAVPDWRAINADERWLAWLSEVDDVYGAPRQDALTNAHQMLNAERVITIFNKFKHATEAARPKLDGQQTPADRGAPPPPPQEPAPKRLVSSKLVQQFYNDLAKGRYVGREAEAARLEAEINQAAAEGRVV